MKRYTSKHDRPPLASGGTGVGTPKPPSPPLRRGAWTKERFLTVLSRNVEPHVLDVVQDLCNWTETRADRVWMGRGAEQGSFTFHYLKEGLAISVFTLYADGRFVLNYRRFYRRVTRETLQAFHQRITAIPSFSHIPAEFSSLHTLRIADAFRDPEDIRKFKQAVEWLRDQLK